MKKNFLYVSLILATALVGCKSNEPAPVEEDTTTEEVVEQPEEVIEDTTAEVAPAPVVENKKNTKPAKKQEKPIVVETQTVKVNADQAADRTSKIEKAKLSKEVTKAVQETTDDVKSKHPDRFKKSQGAE